VNGAPATSGGPTPPGSAKPLAVTVVGAGVVGARTARDLLVPFPGGRVPAAVELVSRRAERVERLSSSFGRAARVRVATGGGAPDLGDAAVVVIAREARDQVAVAERALSEGRHVVATTDDPDEVRSLLDLDGRARRGGVALVVGAAMAPGLSCLLVRHAALTLDVVDEIHVARAGAGGPACARQRLRALRGTATDWRDGAWLRRAGFSGRELCWFPDPLGGQDCYRAELADPALLVTAVPGVVRVSARLAASRRDRAFAVLPVLVGPPEEGGPGGARVEVRGRRDGEHVSVVYGVFDRPAAAAAGVAAVAALWVGGRLPGAPPAPAGAAGLAAVGDAGPFLAELARRGIRAATFEGAHVRTVEPASGDDVAAEPAD
jgi:hypothetical protein